MDEEVWRDKFLIKNLFANLRDRKCEEREKMNKHNWIELKNVQSVEIYIT